MNTICGEIDSDKMSRIITKWKDELEAQYLAINEEIPEGRKAYICSPCHAGCAADMLRNVQAARFYMWYTFENLNLIARAPHAYLPILLSDRVPEERELALRFGLELLEQSDLLFVCGRKLSSGMKAEIRRAAELNISITVFDRDLFDEVRKLVRETTGGRNLATLVDVPCYLEFSAEELLG